MARSVIALDVTGLPILPIFARSIPPVGFDEVILYFNVGLKPHAQVKEEMARFMGEVAPAFDGNHQARVGA